MIQYHPTTLAGKGFLITEGARGEGAHLLNAKGERFMERYAPNKMELASRDVVSRAEQTEINEGRGFPDGTVALDITVVPKKRIHEALREIVLVGRDFAGVDITKEPIRIKPGNHYTMGGIKTDVDGRTDIPGLYAAGEAACVSVHGGNRLGANSLLDTLIFGRRSGVDAAARAKRIEGSQPSKQVLEDEQAMIDATSSREKGSGRRVSEIKLELGRRWTSNVAVFRDEAGIQEALETVRRLKEEAKTAYIDDHGTVFNQDVLGGDRARVHARQRRVHLRRRARAQGEPRRPVPHRLPGAQRRGVAQAHRPPAERRRAGDLILRGDDHPVGTRGEDVLMAEYTLKVRRYQPESGDAPYWEEFKVELDPSLSVLDGILQAKDRDDGSLSVRCSCRAAICGSCGMKINGQSGLGCKTQIGEAHDAANRRNGGDNPIVVEPMGNMPVVKDLITDMESTHWKKIRRVTPWLLPHGEPPEREYIVEPESMIDITQSMACIQCGACVSSCLSMEADPDFIGPAALAKAYRFVGDPRDAETKERLHDLADDPHGLYDCTHCFSCVDACPKGVAPMDQIMRLRRRAGEEGIEDPNSGHNHEIAFVKIIEKKGTLDESLLLQESFVPGIKGKLKPSKRAIKEMIGSLPTAIRGIRTGKMRSLKLIPGLHHKLPDGAQDEVKAIYAHAQEHREEFNLYIKGEEGDE